LNSFIKLLVIGLDTEGCLQLAFQRGQPASNTAWSL
jgi:hypothetical protein